jgi:hypothetical protein
VEGLFGTEIGHRRMEGQMSDDSPTNVMCDPNATRLEAVPEEAVNNI